MIPKPRLQLQVKIFLSCILILITVEVAIFLLLKPVAVKHMNRKIWDYIDFRSVAFRDMLEEILQTNFSDSDLDVRIREQFVRDLANVWSAQIWMTSHDGRTLLSSFEGPAPVLPEEEMIEHRNIWILSRASLETAGLDNPFFARISIRLPGNERGFGHVLFGKVDKSVVNEAATVVRWTFVLFLGGIAFGVALLLFPVVVFISKPLRSLNRSAAAFSGGDLSHRVHIQSRDEIGDLGRAFNRMADTMQGMINGVRELTANLSHELRTPLSRMRIALELHREKLRKEGGEIPTPHLDSMEEDIEDMDRLVGQILQLSRLDVKKASHGTDEVDLGRLLRGALERFSPALRSKSIELKTSIAADLPPLSADREDMATAVSNLLDNAVKYTPHHGRVEVTARRQTNRVELLVANSCDPLSDEDAKHIFEPFYRASPPGIPGTGLGLAIVRKIVDNNGGRVESARWEEGGFLLRIRFAVPP